MKLQVHNKVLRLSTMKIGLSEVTSEIFKKWSVKLFRGGNSLQPLFATW